MLLSSEIPGDGKAAHRPHLEVDDGDIGGLLGGAIGGRPWIGVVDQLVSLEAQGGVDAIAAVGVIGDDEDP